MFQRNGFFRNSIRLALAAFLMTIVIPIRTGLSQQSSTPTLTIDFVSDIQPLLSDRCLVCHGPDNKTRQADLRLDERESAFSVIRPGDAQASELYLRLVSEDPDQVMPPPESKLRLSAGEISKIRQWINEGANFRRHWAFEPIVAPVLPTLDDRESSWVRNELDYFVVKKLSSNGLEPSRRADRATLIRRLTLDLTGLPPTAEELDDFLANESAKSYEQLVDRLLSSEHFGEHMAVQWLDVARYADTYGYQNDRYRPMWPWRDWVVSAFNRNLPFDQFITWQLAGDLLPNATQEQILATAFNRNHRQTNEGGSIEEEFRAEYVADRVNTFGAAFLGLTLECARCHDHKYDPITQHDYYQLAAYFNNIDESGLYSHFTEATPTPALVLSNEIQQAKQNELSAEIAIRENQLRELLKAADLEASFASWRATLSDVRPNIEFNTPTTTSAPAAAQDLKTLLQTRMQDHLLAHFPFEELTNRQATNTSTGEVEGKASADLDLPKGKVGNCLKFSGDNNYTFSSGGEFTRHQPFSYSLWLNPASDYERAVVLHRSRAWTDSASRGYELLIEEGRLSAALIHFWPGNAIRVQAVDKLPVDHWSHVAVTYDGSSTAEGLRLYIDGEQAQCEVIRNNLTKHIIGSDGFGGGEVRNVALAERFRDKGFKDGMIDEVRIFDVELTPIEVRTLFVADSLPANLQEVLYNASDPDLMAFFTEQQESTKQARLALQDARSEWAAVHDAIPEIMVMQEMSEARPTYFLIRGAYDAPREQVHRGVPEALTQSTLGPDSSRLDLARWLTAREHPLTSRVAINRIWQTIFGRGLVETAEDFGLQGAPPSQPELFDWLCADFLDHGWDTKRLLKQIVMSATYQQASDPTARLLEIDPDNRLLARGPAVRLSAEMLRDAALASSGLLVPEMGGPPVKPYQPEGLWEEKSGTSYNRDTGDGSHRRSLYTYWKRTSPHPAMMTLDATSREVCVVRRQNTLTPMQVLVFLNDPQYVEAAHALASHCISSCEKLEDQLALAFRSLTAYTPTTQQLDVLAKLYTAQFQEFKSHPDEALALLEVGDYRHDHSLDDVKVAALTVVVQGLLSFDETVMKR
ncbi:MAG: DUF1549 domain-containing protein [Planctomycetales bacterium]|nr:DUF1549 domain-containing protein [Planctomycetales bacterium]